MTKTYDNAARLIAREDFINAVSGGGGLWVEEALKTINSLERELERK